MTRSSTKHGRRTSKPKIALDRERDIIFKIEQINEELTTAADSSKPYLLNQRRRLEAMLDPVFGLAFDFFVEIERLKKEVATAPISQKRRLENRIRRLEAKIASPKKQKALEDRRATVVKCLERFRKGGAPANHTEFIEWLRREGVLTASRNPKTETGHSKGLRSVRQPAPLIAPPMQAVFYDMPAWMKGKEPATLLKLRQSIDKPSAAIASDGDRTRASRGQVIPVSNTTARDILRGVFRLKGQRGKKPGRQNSE